MSTLQRWRTEMQAGWLYREIARSEREPAKAQLFAQLAGTADEQAEILARDLIQERGTLPAFGPDLRARFAARFARAFGVRAARPLLAALKVRGLSVYSHARADGHAMPVSAAEIGARHRRSGGGNLRAAVFGVSDGLVSNTCLVFGVAGAQASPQVVLTTGVAGLLAGAFSMAAGEYVSMRSQRELYESQLAEEREELARYPDEEAEELALIYAARGVPLEQARALTKRIMTDPERMLDTLAREELGLDPSALGSPWGAAWSSFCAFAAGAVVPLLPFLLRDATHPELLAAALSACALFTVGVLVALFSGRGALAGGLRMFAIGAAVGLVTYGIGRLVGVGIAP